MPRTCASPPGPVRTAVTDDRPPRCCTSSCRRPSLTPVPARLGTDDAAHRISLVASQLVGLGIARHALRTEPLASRPSTSWSPPSPLCSSAT
jgi:hypothetical protein